MDAAWFQEVIFSPLKWFYSCSVNRLFLIFPEFSGEPNSPQLSAGWSSRRKQLHLWGKMNQEFIFDALTAASSFTAAQLESMRSRNGSSFDAFTAGIFCLVFFFPFLSDSWRLTKWMQWGKYSTFTSRLCKRVRKYRSGAFSGLKALEIWPLKKMRP